MYARLIYDNGSAPLYTTTDMCNDIVRLLTGTIDINLLSAAVRKSGTSIDTSWAPGGWTVHDAAAGGGAQVVKSPLFDDPTKFKYLWLKALDTIQVGAQMYENWDAVAHAGTNAATTDGVITGQQIIYVTSGPSTRLVTVYVHSSARHFSVHLFDNTAGANYGISGLYEHTRNSPWDTVANGYTPAVMTNQTTWSTTTLANATTYPPFASCRFFSNAHNVGDVTGTSAAMGLKLSTGSMYPASWALGSGTAPTSLNDLIGATTVDSRVNVVGGKSDVLYPFGTCRPDLKHAGGDISMFSENYFTTFGYGATEDTITLGDGTVYVVWATVGTTSTGYRFAVRRG